MINGKKYLAVMVDTSKVNYAFDDGKYYHSWIEKNNSK